jgi:hypothetical protein
MATVPAVSQQFDAVLDDLLRATGSSRTARARRCLRQLSATMRCWDGFLSTTPARRIIGATPMSRQSRRRRGASGN